MLILLTEHEKGMALVRPGEFLGDKFGAYKAACDFAGVTYQKKLKGSIASPEAIVRLVAALKEREFRVDVDPALGARLAEDANKARAVGAAAGERAMSAVRRAEALNLRLYDFQVEGVGVLAAHPRFVLGDRMGLGKTIQEIMCWADDVAALIVVPGSLKYNWKAEIEKWRPDLRVRVLSGRGSFQWPEAGEVVILNYDILPEDSGTCPWPVHVVADEAHALKSAKAQRTVRFREMARRAREAGGGTHLLTGTPILNRPGEFFQLLAAADLVRDFCTGWMEFCRLFRGRRGAFGGFTFGDPLPEVVERMRRVMLSRKREEVLPDLPTKTYGVREVDIAATDRRELDRLVEEMREQGVDLDAVLREAGETAGATIDFATASRLRRVLATAKIPAVLAIAEEYEEQEEPLVVFSAHVDPVVALGRRPGWATVTGGQDSKLTNQIKEDFQAGRLKGIALTTQAGGTGLTLTRACHLVFVDLLWTPELNEQAADRVCRIGQTRGVTITTLVADHETDRHVARVIAPKVSLIERSTLAAAVVKAPDMMGDLAAGLEGLAKLDRPADLAALPAEGCLPTAAPLPQAAPAPARWRPAETAVERWAVDVLFTVAGMDGDHAAKVNGVGFSKMDGRFGHSLAQQLKATGKLAVKQWPLAVRLATKYRRQAGSPPPTVEEGINVEG